MSADDNTLVADADGAMETGTTHSAATNPPAGDDDGKPPSASPLPHSIDPIQAPTTEPVPHPTTAKVFTAAAVAARSDTAEPVVDGTDDQADDREPVPGGIEPGAQPQQVSLGLHGDEEQPAGMPPPAMQTHVRPDGQTDAAAAKAPPGAATGDAARPGAQGRPAGKDGVNAKILRNAYRTIVTSNAFAPKMPLKMPPTVPEAVLELFGIVVLEKQIPEVLHDPLVTLAVKKAEIVGQISQYLQPYLPAIEVAVYVESLAITSYLVGGLFLTWLTTYFRFSFAWVVMIMYMTQMGFRRNMTRLRTKITRDISGSLERQRVDKGAETVAWMNAFLARFWVMYEPGLSATIKALVDDVLVASKPGFIEDLRLTQFTLGTEAPRIELIRTHPGSDKPESMYMEWELNFQPTDEDRPGAMSSLFGNMGASSANNDGDNVFPAKHNSAIEITAKVGKGFASIPIPVLLKEVSFSGRLEVHLTFSHDFPHIKTVKVGFVEKPLINFILRPLKSMDIMDLPGLNTFIHDQINWQLSANLVHPNFITLDVPQLMGMVQTDRPLGILSINIAQAKQLRNQETTGTSDPYCRVMLGGQEIYRTKRISNCLDPFWGERAHIVITTAMIERMLGMPTMADGLKPDTLYFEIMDYNEVRKDRTMGMTHRLTLSKWIQAMQYVPRASLNNPNLTSIQVDTDKFPEDVRQAVTDWGMPFSNRPMWKRLYTTSTATKFTGGSLRVHPRWYGLATAPAATASPSTSQPAGPQSTEALVAELRETTPDTMADAIIAGRPLPGNPVNDSDAGPAPNEACYSGILEVVLNSASNLSPKIVSRNATVYMVCRYENRELFRTPPKKRTSGKPNWGAVRGYTFVKDVRTKRANIVFQFFADDRRVAQAELSPKLVQENKVPESLRLFSLHGQAVGDIKMAALWHSVDLAQNQSDFVPPYALLKFRVKNAKELKNVETFGKSDPYCKLQLAGKQIGQTARKSNTLNPVFNETFWGLSMSREEAIVAELWDYNDVAKDRTLGRCEILLSDLLPPHPYDEIDDDSHLPEAMREERRDRLARRAAREPILAKLREDGLRVEHRTLVQANLPSSNPASRVPQESRVNQMDPAQSNRHGHVSAAPPGGAPAGPAVAPRDASQHRHGLRAPHRVMHRHPSNDDSATSAASTVDGAAQPSRHGPGRRASRDHEQGDGHGPDGRVGSDSEEGEAEEPNPAFQSFRVDVWLPVYRTKGDPAAPDPAHDATGQQKQAPSANTMDTNSDDAESDPEASGQPSKEKRKHKHKHKGYFHFTLDAFPVLTQQIVHPLNMEQVERDIIHTEYHRLEMADSENNAKPKAKKEASGQGAAAAVAAITHPEGGDLHDARQESIAQTLHKTLSLLKERRDTIIHQNEAGVLHTYIHEIQCLEMPYGLSPQQTQTIQNQLSSLVIDMNIDDVRVFRTHAKRNPLLPESRKSRKSSNGNNHNSSSSDGNPSSGGAQASSTSLNDGHPSMDDLSGARPRRSSMSRRGSLATMAPPGPSSPTGTEDGMSTASDFEDAPIVSVDEGDYVQVRHVTRDAMSFSLRAVPNNTEGASSGGSIVAGVAGVAGGVVGGVVGGVGSLLGSATHAGLGVAKHMNPLHYRHEKQEQELLKQQEAQKQEAEAKAAKEAKDEILLGRWSGNVIDAALGRDKVWLDLTHTVGGMSASSDGTSPRGQVFARVLVSMAYAPCAIPPSVIRAEELGGAAASGASGHLRLEILKGRGLPAADASGTSDPYVHVYLNGHNIHKTKHIKRTLNPDWNDAIDMRIQAQADASLDLVIRDYNTIKRSVELGQISLDISGLTSGQSMLQTLPLTGWHESAVPTSEAPTITVRMLFEADDDPHTPNRHHASTLDALHLGFLRKLSPVSTGAGGRQHDAQDSMDSVRSSEGRQAEAHTPTMVPTAAGDERERGGLSAREPRLSTSWSSMHGGSASTPSHANTLMVPEPRDARRASVSSMASSIMPGRHDQLIGTILAARNLPAMDRRGTSDPYIRVFRSTSTKTVFKTSVIKKTLNPVWEGGSETFRVAIPTVVGRDVNAPNSAELVPTGTPPTGLGLQFQVWDHNTLGSDKLIGSILLDSDQLVGRMIRKQQPISEKWYTLDEEYNPLADSPQVPSVPAPAASATPSPIRGHVAGPEDAAKPQLLLRFQHIPLNEENMGSGTLSPESDRRRSRFIGRVASLASVHTKS